MAMGRPIIPVPGIPTPMEFFRIFELKLASIRNTGSFSTSLALATANATAIGSVHPIAGTTSRFIKDRISSIFDLSIFSLYCKILCFEIVQILFLEDVVFRQSQTFFKRCYLRNFCVKKRFKTQENILKDKI
jgi:hypothetical protein